MTYSEQNRFADCRLCTLYSGSDGNSTYISGGGTSLLIDAGKSARALTNALKSVGGFPENPEKPPVDAIFITHEHTDHISALAVFLKKYPIPVHVTEQSAEKLYRLFKDAPICDCIHTHTPLYTVEVGNMKVRSFPTSHDSRMSVGYRIEIEGEDTRHVFGYATDLGIVTPSVRDALLGCEAVVLESNHDPDMLLDGPYPFDLKMRIRSRLGHLSNPDAAAFAATLAASGTSHFLLAHLSKENNMPFLAYGETFSAIADESVVIRVAAPDAVTDLFSEETEEPFRAYTDPLRSMGGTPLC
ncbi:MAG: MBL fold metallo-hydrolase [Clostridia bacterium]|nr:MBL fold metallo-hydrolase [Clostridia bacterium]